MKPSDSNDSRDQLSLFPFRDISFESPKKEMLFPPSRMKLPEEDPFSLKVIEKLEREGLLIRWRFGYRLANRYEIRRIHSGGMGIVWIVEDLFDNRKPYAAKSVKPFFRKPATDEGWERREESIQRFLEECKIWVDLEKHRHIVYAEFLEKIEGVPLVMSEYIEGGDLSEWVKKGPIPIEQVLEFAIQFCMGMEYANDRGVVVHRDIKPGNLMVDGDVLKINDFGLSKAIESAEAMRQEREIEAESTLDIDKISISRGMGTPFYMAPEQFPKRILEYLGYPIYSIDIPTDVFAFGLILYEMVKGSHPYLEKWDQKLWDKAHQIASKISMPHGSVYCFLKSADVNLSPPISSIEHLDNIILKCLTKNPDERYQSFTELKEELLKVYDQVTGKKFAIVEEPPPKPNFKNKGKTAFILGREEEAIKFYDKALEEDPGDTDVWLEKGLAMAEMGKLREFVTCVELLSYLKPSKRFIQEVYEDKILDSVAFSNRDLRWLDDVASRYATAKELNTFVSQYIKKQRSELFKDLNPDLVELLYDLEDKNKDTRSQAVCKLGEFKDPSIIPALMVALKDEDVGIRSDAVKALGGLQDSSIIPGLLTALEDEAMDVRESAATELGEFNDILVVSALVKALKDECKDVRSAAALSLGKIRDASVKNYLMDSLMDEDIEVRSNAAKALRELKDSSIISPVIEFSKSKIPKIRFYAVEALETLGHRSAIPALIETLQDGDESVRTISAKALGELQDPSAIDPLLKALKDRNKYVRIYAARALIKLKEFSGFPLLVEALDDEDTSANHIAAIALKESNTPSGVYALIDFLRRRNVDPVFSYFWGEPINPCSLPVLFEALKDENINVKGFAHLTLKTVKDPSAVPLLIEALKDKHNDVRLAAIGALRNLSHPSALPNVREALQDEQADVRSLAAEALGGLHDLSVIPDLMGALHDEYENVRAAAVRALSELRDSSSLPALVEALQDTEPDVRMAAIDALGELSEPSVVPLLIKAFSDEDVEVRFSARRTLRKFVGRSVFPALINSLKDEEGLSKLDSIRRLRWVWSKEEDGKVKELKQSFKLWSALEWNKKGLETFESGNKEEAIKCFEKAIEIDTDWEEPRENFKKVPK